MEDISAKDIGALEADVRTLTDEVRLLRQEMAQVNALINQGKGGMWVLMLVAGAVGATFMEVFKHLMGR